MKQASKHKSRQTIQNMAMYDYILQELGQVTARVRTVPWWSPTPVVLSPEILVVQSRENKIWTAGENGDWGSVRLYL